MPLRSVELSEHTDHFIDEAVESGRFASANETVGEALRLLEEREREEQAKIAWLQAAAKEGFDALDRGEGIRFESMDALAAHIRAIGAEVRATAEASAHG